MEGTHPEDQKCKRISQSQLRYFINFAKRHPELMRSKTKTWEIQQHTDKLWKELAMVLNDIPGPSRSPSRWREAMRNWKKQLRCRIKKAKVKNPDDTAMMEIIDVTDFDDEALAVFNFVDAEASCSNNMEFEDESEIDCKPILNNLPTVREKSLPDTPFDDGSPSGSKRLHPMSPNISSSDDDASNHSDISSSPKKKKSKCSTQQLFAIVLDSMKKREEREEKMVEALLKLGEGLLAVANAIANK